MCNMAVQEATCTVGYLIRFFYIYSKRKEYKLYKNGPVYIFTAAVIGLGTCLRTSRKKRFTDTHTYHSEMNGHSEKYGITIIINSA